MNLEELYSESNCMKVAEWMGLQINNSTYSWFTGGFFIPKNLPGLFRSYEDVPERIRQRLAKEGFYVSANVASGKVELCNKDGEARHEASWTLDDDPTGGHALFQALLECLQARASKARQ